MGSPDIFHLAVFLSSSLLLLCLLPVLIVPLSCVFLSQIRLRSDAPLLLCVSTALTTFMPAHLSSPCACWDAGIALLFHALLIVFHALHPQAIPYHYKMLTSLLRVAHNLLPFPNSKHPLPCNFSPFLLKDLFHYSTVATLSLFLL